LDPAVKKIIAMLLLGAFLCVSTVSVVGCSGDTTKKADKDKDKDKDKK
jgi:hypothetical protein